MTFIRTANGVLNSRFIVRIWRDRNYVGYARVQFMHSDYEDGSEPSRALVRIEDLEAIGITPEDLEGIPLPVAENGR